MSVSLFRISYLEESRFNYTLDALRENGLPGVKCSVCRCTGGGHGSYPHIRLPEKLRKQKEFRRGWPVPEGRLNELIQEVRPFVPADLPLGSGMGFGPLTGKARGRCGPVLWFLFDLLLSRLTVAQLQAKGISLLTAEPRIPATKTFNHVEIVAIPRLRMAAESLPSGALQNCPGCGRLELFNNKEWDGEYAITEESIPLGESIFRIVDFEQQVIVTKELLDRLMEIKDVEVAVTPIPVIS